MLTSADIVMDIGANIGAFSWQALNRGNVNQVIAYEPEPDNYNLMTQNLTKYYNFIPKKGAITPDHDSPVDFYLNTKTNSKSTHSMYRKNWRSLIHVDAFNFSDEIRTYRPTAIKCDIEGGEYYILPTLQESDIRLIVIEFHFSQKEWKVKLPSVLEHLRNLGFKELVPFTYNDKTRVKMCFLYRP